MQQTRKSENHAALKPYRGVQQLSQGADEDNKGVGTIR